MENLVLKSKFDVIEITDDDIINGIPGDSCNCAISRAVKRKTGSTEVTMGSFGLWVNGQLSTPKSENNVLLFMERFDDKEKRHLCKPMTFELTYWSRDAA